MTEWWQKGYPGAPMVQVNGFPRPLYPPDAKNKGKTPSKPGPDVIAYKRTVSRAGRWPWQAFDNTFSNAFSHGKSGNVKDSGVAGIQRQQDIDDTGWIGKATFNTLRSIKIPEGLPNAGQMAMDAYSVNLINQAFEQFGGHEPAPAPERGTLRQQALQKAISQLGTKESPANSNITPYTKWYGMTGPWCAMFCTWSYENAGDSPSFVKGSKYAYVPYIVADARAKKNGLQTVGADSVIPGDLVCYDWGWDGEFDHVGIFEAWQPGSGSTFTAIEGNTSTSNNSHGGEVMRRTRRTPDQSTVFVRVAEPK